MKRLALILLAIVALVSPALWAGHGHGTRVGVVIAPAPGCGHPTGQGCYPWYRPGIYVGLPIPPIVIAPRPPPVVVSPAARRLATRGRGQSKVLATVGLMIFVAVIVLTVSGLLLN